MPRCALETASNLAIVSQSYCTVGACLAAHAARPWRPAVLLACRDEWQQAYQELEMQRGYCAVSTKYSPALIQASALASPAAFLKASCSQLPTAP